MLTEADRERYLHWRRGWLAGRVCQGGCMLRHSGMLAALAATSSPGRARTGRQAGAAAGPFETGRALAQAAAMLADHIGTAAQDLSREEGGRQS